MGKIRILNFGHWLQIVWILVAIPLQFWIGGIKGFVVVVIGIILFLINGLLVNKSKDTTAHKKVQHR